MLVLLHSLILEGITLKKISLFTLSFFMMCCIFTSSAQAQVQYEDVVEKIHYTHPNMTTGGQPFDAKKEIGSENPTLRVFIWADLGETFTKKFFDEAFEALEKKHSQDTQFIFVHRSFLMQNTSVRAGIIGECAAQQGQFWNNIRPITQNLNDLSNLGYLNNIDKTQMEKCIADPLTKNVITASEDSAKYVGINGIPTLIIQNVAKPQPYSVKVSGAQSLSIFERAFQEAKDGDLSKQEIEDLKTQMTVLKQNVQQTQMDVQEVKKEQSGIAQEIENLKKIVQSILDRLKSLFF